MSKKHTGDPMTHEQWLKSQGILKAPPRLPEIKRQYKSLEGQQSLLDRDADGKPATTKKPKRKKK